jgi:malonyl-CoA O-methyltransferase
MQSKPSNSDGTFIEYLSTQEGYDRWSAIYDTDGNPLVALEEPLVDHLLGDIRQRVVIDLGCGTGRHSIRMSRAGARVIGVDFSERMLAKAREKAAGLNISFHTGDLLHRLPFADKSFDRVVCGLVLDHIPTLDQFFGEIQRLCKSDGCAIVSVMHPAMMLRGVQARFWDPATGREVRPASQGHQISDYVMAAVRSGFQLEHLSEHTVDQALADRLVRAERYLNWPILLVMKLSRKLA